MIRHLDECAPKWQEIIRNNPGDVYGHFWEKSDKSQNDTLEKFIELFNPKKVEVENFDIFKESTIDILTKNITPPDDLLLDLQNVVTSGKFFSMHYKIWKANQLSLVDNYDIIVRCRTDCYPPTNILIEKNDYINVPVGYVFVPAWPFSMGNIDMFAYGSRKLMNYYSSVYLYTTKYIFEGYYCYPYEYILSVHLNEKNIQIRQLPINIIGINGFLYNQFAEKIESINLTKKYPIGDKKFYAYTENRLL